jgi:hypothetical protein
VRRRFTGPWAVDEDLSYSEIAARRRPNPRYQPQNNTPEFQNSIDDAAYLRTMGEPDAHIAKRLHLTPEALEMRLRRAGVSERITPTDRAFTQALNRVIASGQPFSAHSLPTPGSETFAANAMVWARKQGRIVKVGMRRTDERKMITLWQGVQAEAEAA